MGTKVSVKRLRPPVKWHGGKHYLAPKIVPLLPSHRVYIEPFIGGGSVLLNKPKAEREIAGDLNDKLIKLWKCLSKDRYRADFLGALQDLPYTSEEWEFWGANLRHGDFVWSAVAFLVRNRFSRGGLAKTFAWSDRLRGGKPGDANAWDTIRAELPAIAERVRDVEFRRCEAVDLICEFQHDPDALIYADPPYVHATRTARAAYEFEMDDERHRWLLKALESIRCKVVLSGYRCDLYMDLLRDWDLYEFPMPNHAGQGKAKQRRTECLWIKG